MENWDNYVKQLSACRNFSRVFSPKKATQLYGPEVYKSFKRKRFGCPSCFTPDKDMLEITSGPYKGFKTTTTSYFNSYSVGHVFDLNTEEDKTAAVRMTDVLDRMGIDMLSFCTMMDFLITESEQGNLDPDRFGLRLERNMDTVLGWAKAISRREKRAEIVADGWHGVLTDLGEEFRRRAPVIKNCDVLWDPRPVGLGTMEFEQIVSLKGPRSASGGSPTYVPGQPEENLQLFRRHLDRMGADGRAIDRIMDSPIGFNVGRMTRYSEDWYTTLSSLGICNRHFNNRFYSFDLCHRLFVAATGFDVEVQDFRDSVARIWNTLKQMNLKEGFGAEDDRPPDLWFEPMEGPDGEKLVIRDYFGKKQLTREDIGELVRDYYGERGWFDLTG
jgi:aldehyde:ferredoxin oxidoreductase